MSCRQMQILHQLDPWQTANPFQHCGRSGVLATWCERGCIRFSGPREVKS